MNDFIGDKESITQYCSTCEKLTKEVERLQRILKQVYNVGFNKNCMFCGFKDRVVIDNLFGGVMEER